MPLPLRARSACGTASEKRKERIRVYMIALVLQMRIRNILLDHAMMGSLYDGEQVPDATPRAT